jgi:hypothetical protein
VYLVQMLCVVAVALLGTTSTLAAGFAIVSAAAPFVLSSWAATQFLQRNVVWGIVGSILANVIFSITVAVIMIGLALAYTSKYPTAAATQPALPQSATTSSPASP